MLLSKLLKIKKNNRMQTIKDILEIIYFLSGPAVAFFAFKALSQIKEAKKQVEETKNSRIISSKRDAYKVAAEKCDCFLNIIIPHIDNLDRAIASQGTTFFADSRIEMNKSEIKVKPAFKNVEDVRAVFNLPILEVFNPLESFSIFFTSGVAEEKIGYLTVGQTYCSCVRRFLPLLIIISGEKHFLNILNLYQIWNSRIEKENLESEKAKIDKKLSENVSIIVKTIGLE